VSNRMLRVMLRRAEKLVTERSADDQSDADLLRRFVSDHDDAAFTALTHRHGPMVWGVCRQMLSNPADADDAFQAVFLVLIQSGSKLGRVKSLGGWLHGVTVRVCLKARRTAVRRKHREKASARPEANRAEPHWDDLHAAVHEEVDRLPSSLRTAFVLCDLQGVRQPDAAERLGWKLGTLSGRLTRARQMLLSKLTARGMAPVLAVGTVSIGGTASNAGLPAALAEKAFALVRHGAHGLNESGIPSPVIELARGATEGMMSKMKLFVGSVMAASGLIVATGSGWLPTVEAQQPAKTRPDLPPGQGTGAGPTTPLPASADAPVAADPTAKPSTRYTGTASTAPTPVASSTASAQRFEHKSVNVPATQTAFAALLKKEEQAGWEFVGQVSGGEAAYSQLVFKRPKGGTATAGTLTPTYGFPTTAAPAYAPAPVAESVYTTPPASYPARTRPGAASGEGRGADLEPARTPGSPVPTGNLPDTKPAEKSTLPATSRFGTGSKPAPATTGDVLVIKLKSLGVEEARRLILPLIGNDSADRGGAVEIVTVPDSSTVVLYGANQTQTDKITALLEKVDSTPNVKR
jgi:RNA polymerase sigma factor (sigma-70 family)